MIDTHVHLNNDAFYEDPCPVLARARDAGVDRFVVVGFTEAMNERAARLAAAHEGLYATAGLHPTTAHEADREPLQKLESRLEAGGVVAVGECGLDFHHDKEHKSVQAKRFEAQIRLAKQHDLPLVIHMREAAGMTYDILSRHAPIKGVMHCYSGSVEMAHKFLKLGLHISLGGPVTFKNAKTPKEVAKIVPDERLLIETDAPFLAPHPYRGKQNEPSLLPLIANQVATLRGTSSEYIDSLTSENAVRLFGLE